MSDPAVDVGPTAAGADEVTAASRRAGAPAKVGPANSGPLALAPSHAGSDRRSPGAVMGEIVSKPGKAGPEPGAEEMCPAVDSSAPVARCPTRAGS